MSNASMRGKLVLVGAAAARGRAAAGAGAVRLANGLYGCCGGVNEGGRMGIGVSGESGIVRIASKTLRAYARRLSGDAALYAPIAFQLGPSWRMFCERIHAPT
ncbi:hypothetical protein FEP63_05654 [Burkholderia multivorans]|nr:hypothetical protein [Burkholderia multivorans]MDR8879167.1 hypothetical protein [Burkholderia multivorans]MDR8889961.1 hypothetical protein [Burkholderia multivorans]MDR8895104.1 hypothetical protein [Burkholderia multivorans]MDR8902224.1 hypothetical protein [Burkholderia multivorans]